MNQNPIFLPTVKKIMRNNLAQNFPAVQGIERRERLQKE
jgi:hypothetical protein